MSADTAEDLTVAVAEEWQVGLARRRTMELGRQLGFNETTTHICATIVSELAYNLHFHTERGGRIVLRPIVAGAVCGLEIESCDDGPGIADVGLAFADGYSTRGGLGGGLPGVRRLSDELEIETGAGAGTRIVVRRWERRRRRGPGR